MREPLVGRLEAFLLDEKPIAQLNPLSETVVPQVNVMVLNKVKLL